MSPNFAGVVKNFAFAGIFIEASVHGCGHINDTYVTRFRQADGTVRRYILQRVNTRVFKELDKLMANIGAVTRHLRRKIVAAGGDPERETLNLIPAVDGYWRYVSPEGDYWRAYTFIEGARTYQVVESPRHLYNAGKVFGRFQCWLNDFPAGKLHDTIPDFHHTGKRFASFQAAVAGDARKRAREVRAEIDFVQKHAPETTVLTDLITAGRLPLRVTHNDTKFNNVMIDDATGEGICLIDLDTVMPGLALYDFGDAIRSGAMPAAEDERDLARVRLDLELYENYARGYLETARGFLTPLEIDLLPFAAKLITLEQGMRFLADHLNGDVYYKIHRENHNLDRARTQLKMVADMEGKFQAMQAIVAKYRYGKPHPLGASCPGEDEMSLVMLVPSD